MQMCCFVSEQCLQCCKRLVLTDISENDKFRDDSGNAQISVPSPHCATVRSLLRIWLLTEFEIRANLYLIDMISIHPAYITSKYGLTCSLRELFYNRNLISRKG